MNATKEPQDGMCAAHNFEAGPLENLYGPEGTQTTETVNFGPFGSFLYSNGMWMGGPSVCC